MPNDILVCSRISINYSYGPYGLVRSLYLVALIEFRASIGTTSITKRSRNPAMAARFKEFVRETLKHK